MDESHVLVIDAVPQRLPVNINENKCNKEISLEILLSDLSIEDYKSIFFLLMDFIGLNNFLSLTKKEKLILKQTFKQMYRKNFKDDRVLIELFGTLKKYKKLRLLDSCDDLYKSQEKNFCQIEEIWKMLYSLCEELIDEEVERLKKMVPNNFKDQILSAEDWFCWALQSKMFCKMDVSHLEIVFDKYPTCLNIIKSYKDFLGFYEIKTPTISSKCGIALIINFDTFDEKSHLEERKYSDADVNSLVELWETFGFETKVSENLTYLETFQKLNYYATVDHSQYDAFVCCILSHGASNAVFSSDGESIPIPNIIAEIVDHCLTLDKKPKLFFIQACQGINIHQGLGKPVYQFETDSKPVIKTHPTVYPILCDVLTVTSSIDGYVSFRCPEGSWFIQTLCKLMMKYGNENSIEEVMIKVNDEVRKYSADLGPYNARNACQFVPHSSTLGKKLILKKQIR